MEEEQFVNDARCLTNYCTTVSLREGPCVKRDSVTENGRFIRNIRQSTSGMTWRWWNCRERWRSSNISYLSACQRRISKFLDVQQRSPAGVEPDTDKVRRRQFFKKLMSKYVCTSVTIKKKNSSKHNVK